MSLRFRADGKVWRAELTIGTMEGYEGPEVVTPGHVAALIKTFYTTDRGEWFPSIVWTRGTVQGANFSAETVIRVTLESNPLYSPNATEDDVAIYASDMAHYLAQELKQARVYMAVYPIRSMIVEP